MTIFHTQKLARRVALSYIFANLLSGSGGDSWALCSACWAICGAGAAWAGQEGVVCPWSLWVFCVHAVPRLEGAPETKQRVCALSFMLVCPGTE